MDLALTGFQKTELFMKMKLWMQPRSFPTGAIKVWFVFPFNNKESLLTVKKQTKKAHFALMCIIFAIYVYL